MTPIKAAIIGYGMAAKVFHAPFLDTNPGFNLCKVVERHRDESKKDYPDVEIVRSTDELLADDSISLVVITTPNKFHFPLAKQALLSGKNVVIDKPFTVTTEEADELIKIAHDNELILSVYQNRRWDGDFLTVKKIINDGYLGDPVEFESHIDRFRNYLKPKAWRESDEPGSGLFYDLSPHLIDQSLQLFGTPDELFADIRTQREGGKTDDQFELILYYKKLKVTLKAGMLAREPGPRFRLYGTQGSFVKYGEDPQEADSKGGMSPLDPNWGKDDENHLGTLNADQNGLHFQGKIETLRGCYQKYYENIYEAIANKKEPAVKPEEARDVMKIIELAFRSNHVKKTLKFA